MKLNLISGKYQDDYVGSGILKNDAGVPITPRQKKFYEKHKWGTKGITRLMAWRQMNNWLLERKRTNE